VIAIIQLDAVSVPLVETMLAEGRLPTLAGLRDRGRWIELETPATHFPAGTYASLYSGVRVADHGMYYAFQWSPGEQRVRWRETFPSPRNVWDRIGAAGKRALVIDPYETTAPQSVGGVAISGWQFINVMSLNGWSVPRAARSELARVLGRPTRMEEVFGEPTVRGLRTLRGVLQAATERVVEAAILLLRRERFDLAWVTFLSAHLAGHMFWDLSQLDVTQLDASTRTMFEHTLTDIYAQIDHGIGRIVEVLPDDADVVIASPMGMGANMSRVDFLPGMLESVLRGNGSGPRRAESRGERFIWKLRGSIPTPVRAKVAAALHGPLTREATMRLSTIGVDWSRTPAFLLPSDHFGQVRLNVCGRERDGIVDPRDVDDLVERLQSGLLSYRDPDGEPSVVAVERARDVVGEGERADLLPDLVVRWSERPATDLDYVTSPQFGDVPRTGRGSGRSGAHRPQAWALVAPGTSAPAEHARPSVLDLAPTACAALGVDVGELPGLPLLVSE